MFRLVNMLSKESVEERLDDSIIMPPSVDNFDSDHVREQPMILSAVEATLSSYYKDEGDALLDMLARKRIVVLFDDDMPADIGEAYYSEEDNVIVLSSKPHDILDMAKEMHRVLSTLN